MTFRVNHTAFILRTVADALDSAIPSEMLRKTAKSLESRAVVMAEAGFNDGYIDANLLRRTRAVKMGKREIPMSLLERLFSSKTEAAKHVPARYQIRILNITNEQLEAMSEKVGQYIADGWEFVGSFGSVAETFVILRYETDAYHKWIREQAG